jgi:hypothetical protein
MPDVTPEPFYTTAGCGADFSSSHFASVEFA